MNKEMYTVIGVGVALAAILITSMGGLRAEMRDEFSTMRDEHAAIRVEMRDEHAAIRAEMRDEHATIHAEMRDEHAAIRAEMRDEHAAIRAEVREGRVSLRTEMREGFASVRTELTDVRAELSRLGERVARIEVRLDITVEEPPTAAQ